MLRRGNRAVPRRTLAALALLVAGCSAATPPVLLEPGEQLSRFDWWDNRDEAWFADNIPFFESPDPDIDATYYYRWELLTKHLTYGSPASGYTFTEFIDRPFWSGRYGAISCPLGHQLYEARWLRDPLVVGDFARYWFETPGAEPRSYSNWYGDGVWAAYTVLGDTAFLRTAYPHMRSHVDGWTEEHWDPDHRMYRWVGAWDGMETNINSRLTDDEFGGAEGYRPTLNSYLWADLSALSRTASLFGEDERAAEYGQRAADLKARIQSELWDPARGFFFHQFAFDENGGIRAGTRTYESGPFAGDPHGRELIGYVPWQFGLPDPGYEGAWAAVLDSSAFAAPFGPTTVEQGDPQFMVSPRCCVWSGNAWPYATAQTLTAMARLLHDYDQDVVTRADYFAALRGYAMSQRRDGRPYVAEAADPHTGSWDGHNTFYHSEHYFHSTFVDLIITGLVGLRPQADESVEVAPLAPDAWDWFALDRVRYHGHDLTIVWDRDGTRYGRGPGLSVWVDGRVRGRTEELGTLHVSLGPREGDGPLGGGATHAPRMLDVAVNNDGGYFPLATASSSHPLAPPFYAVDGSRWYHPSPPNRWVAAPSTNSTDWFEVDFGAPRTIREVTLYFLDDADLPRVEATGAVEEAGFPRLPGATGPTVRAPASYLVQWWDGATWVDVPNQTRRPSAPSGRMANHVTFPEVTTSRMRAVLHHQPGATSGLAEFEAWSGEELPLAPPSEAVADLAWNAGGRPFPTVSASFSMANGGVEQAVDGRFGFTRYSRNRWATTGSPNASDWIEVDFGEPRVVGRVELYLYGDGRGIAAPRTVDLQRLDGDDWLDLPTRTRTPDRPTAWALNTLEFGPVEARRIRVILHHDLPAASGVTELRIRPD